MTGCKENDEVKNHEPILTGLLIAGESPTDIRLFYLEESGEEEGVTDANVVLTSGAGIPILLEHVGNGFYSSSDAVDEITAGESYEIEASFGSEMLSASALVPPEFTVTAPSNTQFTLDPNNPDEEAFEFSWETDEELSYVITLEPLDPAPVSSYFYPSDDFEEAYGLPIIEGQATLRASYFNYFGSYICTVYAIRRDYEAVFFFNPVANVRGLLVPGMDNVQGGAGFFTGVSKNSFIIDVN